MNENVVTIVGLPSTCNPVKVKLLFESKCKVSIDSIKVKNDVADVILKDENDAKAFRESLPKTIAFGGSSFDVALAEDTTFGKDDTALKNTEGKTDDLIEWNCDRVHSWYDLEELPACKIGLLVQCEKLPLPSIQAYFENKETSNGGAIAKVILMVDGILIIFQNEDVASQVWSWRPHRISGVPVSTFVKSIPCRHHEKLLIKYALDFEDKGIDEEWLKRTLQIASEKITPEIVKQYQNVFFVSYKNDIGAKEITDMIEQLKNWEECEVSHLRKTDCIKVKNASPEISNDEFKILFENQVRSEGGPVTRIHRVKDNAILVYFGSYADAENVFRRFRNDSMRVFNHQLKITRYYHCFCKLHENRETDQKNVSVRPNTPEVDKELSKKLSFTFPGVRADFLQLFSKKEKHLKMLEQQLGSSAELKLTNNGIKVKIPDDGQETPRKTEKECREIIFKFLEQYLCDKCDNFGTAAQLQVIRIRNLDYRFEASFMGDSEDVMVRWSGEKKDCLVAFGITADVNSLISSMKETIADSGHTMVLPAKKFRLLMDANAIDGIKSDIKNVDVKCHREQNKLVFSSDSLAHIIKAQTAVWKFIQDSHEKDPTVKDTNALSKDSSGDNLIQMEKGKVKYMMTFCQEFKQLCVRKAVTPTDMEDVIFLKGEKRAVQEVLDAVQSWSSDILHDVHTVRKHGAAAFLSGREGKTIIDHASLKNHTVILLESPSAWDQKNQTTASPRMGPTTGVSVDKVEMGPISVSLSEGDITDEKMDAIVNPTTFTFKLDQGGLSAIILKKAGGDIQSEVDKKQGQYVRVSSSGKLPCKRILHVCTPFIMSDLPKCMLHILREADERKCCSLAIPAIGTGFGRWPGFSVANYMMVGFRDFVKNNPTTKHLKIVKIVIHDRKLMPDFKAAFLAAQTGDTTSTSHNQNWLPRSQPTGASASSRTYLSSAQFGNISVSIYQGDITQESNDAIVNSTGSDFDLSKGMVSKAIIAKGGHEIQREVHQVRGKDIRVTRAGKLVCRRIIHVVTQTESSRALKNSVIDVLTAAEKERCSSLSIPALGTGNLGRNGQDVAKVMMKAFDEFMQKMSHKTLYLKVVDIVIFDRSILQDFLKVFNEMKTGEKSMLAWLPTSFRAAVPKISGIIGLNGNNASADHKGTNVDKSPSSDVQGVRQSYDSSILNLHFYSRSQSDIVQTISVIRNEVDSLFSTEIISEDFVASLQPDEVQQISDCGDHNHVSVQKYGRLITVEGEKNEVYRTLHKIKDTLKSIQGKRQSQNTSVFIWQVKKKDGSWKDLEDDVSEAIQEKYLEDSLFVGTLDVGWRKFYLDFRKRSLDGEDMQKSVKKAWTSDVRTSQPTTTYQSSKYSDDGHNA